MAIRVPIDVNGNLRHSGAVSLLEKNGVPAPAEYVALRERIDSFKAISRPLVDRLVEAVLSGKDADRVAEYRAAAIAEQIRSDVDETVVTAGWRRLKEIYSTVALDNYQAIAARWNAAAEEFTAAVGVVDPGASADVVIELDSKSQKLWKRGRELSAQLDELSVILQTAGMLAGISNAETNQNSPVTGQWQDGMKSMLIGLCADPGDLHRRQVWQEWDRGWAATVQLGVTLRAADLETFEAYRRPRPLLERRVVENGVARFQVVDPEDADYEPAPSGAR
ncbi:hypothetical protein [Mycolicibacterium conceptionense]|uniref:hypothetical protein n=1 Tax=Mycolicibacterium conceptionense TaxID=451644 RepID=UPI000AF6CF20|nr:hypothetical protein [Mycolicibacterium conceptionense]